MKQTGFPVKEPFILQENVLLAPYTTLKIGGNARYFVRAETEDAVSQALVFAENRGLPIFVLGGGTNVLIADAGFDGLVLQIALKGMVLSEQGAAATGLNVAFKNPVATAPGSDTSTLIFITAKAGEDWDDFVAYCVENNLAGVECLSGIPGFVGGTPVQNVGAYGQEVSETIVSVRCFDRTQKKIVTLTNAECGFTYRTSIFSSNMRDRYIVLSVTFALKKGWQPKIVYKDLIERFDGRQPSLTEVRSAVLQIRRSKSMVIDADDPNSQSAGSFFKNPIVSKEKLAELRIGYEDIPSFNFGVSVKIPAAWLIENAGFGKGFTLGHAGISTNHTLAIINRGDASAAEILSLKDAIQQAVEINFGILLQPEPVFVGF